MNRITAILKPHPDGTLHLPLPVELRNGEVEVTATLRAVGSSSPLSESSSAPPPIPQVTPQMLQRRQQAFAALRAMGGLADLIPDPAAWQRELRQDRELPGRD